MYVITVIPISRGIGKETLSYFTASKVELGSLVEVPLRKKNIDALVIEIKDARDMKTEIRRADFSLRKVEKLVSKPFLPPVFMKTVEETARFHAATIGATLNVLLPKKILASQRGAAFLNRQNTFIGVSETAGISGSLTDRIESYKEELEKVKVGIIIVPTKERQEVFSKIFDGQVILPSSLVEIPYQTELIIMEDSNSDTYKSISRPFIDFRYAIDRYAQLSGARLIKGTSSLHSDVKKVIEEHKKEDGQVFTSLGKELEKDIKRIKAGQHLFILGTRKGHSGTVLCQDCGHVFTCARCEAPLTLHLKSVKEDFNSMLCHHCGYKTSTMTGCPVCKSWRLKAYGLGIEKIEEDVLALTKKKHIKTYVQRIDSTLKLTPKKIRDFIKTHYEKESAILIGTELLLPYLAHEAVSGKKNTASYIASLDTLLSLPDFSINEKIWRLCSLLDEVTENKVIIQTRNSEHPLLTAWRKHDEKKFWKNELEERRHFNYPPHGVLIKITVKGRKEKIGSEMKKIEEIVKKWKPMVFPAFIRAIKNQHILHVLIVLPKSEWVDEELLRILRSLPPSVIVEVNPRSLL